MAPNGKSYRKAKKKKYRFMDIKKREFRIFRGIFLMLFYISDSKWWGGYLNFMKDRKGVLY